MRLVIHPDGTKEFFDLSVKDAKELIGAAASGTAPATTSTPKRQRKRGRPPKHVTVEQLTDVQLQTWRWLCAHDVDEGVHPQDYADGADINVASARDRLVMLTKLGLARQTAPNRFRPGKDGHKEEHGGH